ncbi:hypothetical protein RvY_17726 [Ramazzottius varieornatus]|uniref:Alpha-1,4-N-acetylglucosaminyltransferase n=1 Tax=Ramazzottius varieornatus TaxID=947166 RepID=A0A1D1W588_RAMVA|nr:hypothetical protein RvY_17726 [Ramazzottius varieornatus]
MIIGKYAMRWLLISMIGLVCICFVVQLLLSESFTCRQVLVDFKSSLFSFQKSAAETLSSDSGALSAEFQPNLIVHYVRYYNVSTPTKEDNSLGLLDCLGLYSVILNLEPDVIYVHTNVPSFWPFDRCETTMNVTIRWPHVELIYAPYEYVANGQRIGWITHEADIRKMTVVEKYGGLTLDFDVYIISGIKVRHLLADNPCIICYEAIGNTMTDADDAVNVGFFGCREPHSTFPQLVLEESYKKNYHSSCWLCNIGIIPMKILRNHTEAAVLVHNVCDTPSWIDRNDFNEDRGVFSWKEKPAFHSFFHNSTFSLDDVMKLDSDLGDVFRWILKGSPAHLVGELN